MIRLITDAQEGGLKLGMVLGDDFDVRKTLNLRVEGREDQIVWKGEEGQRVLGRRL